MSSIKICPNCGASYRGASCEYCRTVDGNFSVRRDLNDDSNNHKGFKVQNESFALAHPEAFDISFDVYSGSTIATFKYRLLLNVTDRKRIISWTYTDSNGNAPRCIISIPPVEYVADSYRNRIESNIGYDRFGLFCASNVTAMRLQRGYGDSRYRNKKKSTEIESVGTGNFSKKDISEILLYCRAFYEAVIGDGVYAAEYDQLRCHYSEMEHEIQEYEAAIERERHIEEKARLENSDDYKKEIERKKDRRLTRGVAWFVAILNVAAIIGVWYYQLNVEKVIDDPYLIVISIISPLVSIVLWAFLILGIYIIGGIIEVFTSINE